MPQNYRVAVIDGEGGFSIEEIASDQTGARLRELIGCRVFTMFSIDGLDFWVDDEGMYNASRNLPLTRLVSTYAELVQYLYGACVIARSDDAGNTVGLTDDDLADIARRHVQYAGV